MTVSMPTLVAARLVAGHVDLLWQAWANGPDDARGCCPVCCGPCSALKDLLDAGLLDELYGTYVDQGFGEMETWDAEKRQVGRKWLLEAWAVDMGCGPHDVPHCQDPTCPDYGDPNFGEGTCPAEHADPHPAAS